MHTPRQLNEVLSLDETLIPMSFLEWKGSKLTLTKAVQLTNNRTTIVATQKAGRAKKVASINQDEPEQEEPLDQSLDGQGEGQPQQIIDGQAGEQARGQIHLIDRLAREPAEGQVVRSRKRKHVADKTPVTPVGRRNRQKKA
jgi:hypothetical protein